MLDLQLDSPGYQCKIIVTLPEFPSRRREKNAAVNWRARWYQTRIGFSAIFCLRFRFGQNDFVSEWFYWNFLWTSPQENTSFVARSRVGIHFLLQSSKRGGFHKKSKSFGDPAFTTLPKPTSAGLLNNYSIHETCHLMKSIQISPRSFPWTQIFFINSQEAKFCLCVSNLQQS